MPTGLKHCFHAEHFIQKSLGLACNGMRLTSQHRDVRAGLSFNLRLHERQDQVSCDTGAGHFDHACNHGVQQLFSSWDASQVQLSCEINPYTLNTGDTRIITIQLWLCLSHLSRGANSHPLCQNRCILVTILK